MSERLAQEMGKDQLSAFVPTEAENRQMSALRNITSELQAKASGQVSEEDSKHSGSLQLSSVHSRLVTAFPCKGSDGQCVHSICALGRVTLQIFRGQWSKSRPSKASRHSRTLGE